MLGASWLRAPASPEGSAGSGTPASAIAKGAPAPVFEATTLDGAPFDLAVYRGRPVILNFWGPSCVPCREEFPLFKQELASHASEDLAIVGVLMDDPVAPAQAFIRTYGATWPTVVDPSGTIKAAYRVAARPQSYFIDRAGILRQIQVGEVTAEDFDRLYAAIAESPGAPSAASSTP
jgi:cytochrome c biogenesis protein CcmG, thiol:disulfide interchange protein DsbE